MTYRIIALQGSTKEGGNTSVLLDQAIYGAEAGGCEVARIAFTHLDPGRILEKVFSRGGPVLGPEMQKIYSQFHDADGIIVASPVYTMGVPGKLKSLMDLFQAFFIAKYEEKHPLVPADKRGRRRGLFISLAGGADCPTVFDGAKSTVTAFFEILDFHYHDDLLIDDMDTIGDVKTRPDLLKSAYDKGHALAKAIKKEKP